MIYNSIIDYLDEEYRKPFLKALKKKNTSEVKKIFDAVLWKLIEDNSSMIAFEKIIGEEEIGNHFKEWREIKETNLSPYYERLKDGWDNINKPDNE